MTDYRALLEQGRAARGVASTQQDPFSEAGASGGFADTALDYGLAAPRGVVGAAMDIYGLLDTVTMDALPDWKTNPLGESKSVGAGLIEGVANFATAFIPVAGVLGKVGKGTALASKAGSLTWKGNLLAGAVADFTAFDGNEARLSDLIQNTSFANPVTEWLASDESDSELYGRLKNVIEGATLGEAVGGLISGVLGKTLGAQRAYRKAIAAGKSKEAAAAAATPFLAGLEPELRMLEKQKLTVAHMEPLKADDGTELFFHGAGDRITEFHEGYSNVANIYGDGLYVTSDAGIALEYSQSGKNRNQVRNWMSGGASKPAATPTVYDVRIPKGAKFYDLDAPLDPEIRRMFEERGVAKQAANAARISEITSQAVIPHPRDVMFDVSEDPWAQALAFVEHDGKPVTLGNVILEYRQTLQSETGDIFDFPDDVKAVVIEPLQKQGYVGFTHQGGVITGGRSHTVRIIWEPENFVKIGSEKALIVSVKGEDGLALDKATQKLLGSRAEAADAAQGIDSWKAPEKQPAGSQMPQEEADKLANDAFTHPDPVVREQALSKLAMSMEGKETGQKALKSFLTSGQVAQLHPKAKEASEWLVNRVSADFFEGVSARVASNNAVNAAFDTASPKTLVTGYYDFLKNMVTVNDRVLRSGNFDRTFLHEIWHSMERFVGPEDQRLIQAQFEAEKAAWTAKNPEWAAMPLANRPDQIARDSYRFENAKEWFAESMRDKTIKRFTVEADIAAKTGLTKLFAQVKLTIMDMVNSWKVRFGNDAVERMFVNVMNGKPMEIKSPRGIVHNTEAGQIISPMLEPNYTQYEVRDPAKFRLLRDLGHSDEQIKGIFKRVEERFAAFNEADVDLGANPRKLTKVELLATELAKHDTNLDPWDAPDSAKAVFRTYELLADEVYRDEVGTLPFKDMLEAAKTEAAEVVNADPDEFLATVLARAGQDRTNMRRIYTRLIMYKGMASSYGDKLYTFAKQVSEGADSTENLAKLAKMEDFYFQLVGAVKSLTAETGRSLVSNRVSAGMLELDPAGRIAANMDIANAAGGAEALRKRAKAIVEAGEGSSAAGVTKVVEAQRRSYGNMLLEYWMNSILSGGKTMTVNALGGALMSYWRPLEVMAGAWLNKTLVSNPKLAAEYKATFDRAFLQMRLLSKQFKDASRMSKAVWRTGENVLAPKRGVSDLPQSARGAISARNLGIQDGTKAATYADKLGNFIRIPSRVLSSTDEFWKQVNYRAVVEADLTLKARANGLDGKAAAEFVASNMEKMISDGQAYSTQALVKRAQDSIREMETKSGTPMLPSDREAFIDSFVKKNWDENLSALSTYAQAVGDEVAFSTPLPTGSLSKRVSDAVTAHPYLRAFMPFVRTPLNIAMYSGRRLSAPFTVGAQAGLLTFGRLTGVEGLQKARGKLLAQLSSSDARVSAEASGRILAGVGAITGISLAVTQGTITGGGPSDVNKRKLLAQTGWQPYSVKIGDSYISYQRLDPFASMIGTVADFVEYHKWISPEDEDNATSVANAIMSAFAENFTNKTYTTGIQNFVEALDDPNRFMPRLLERYAASMVPNFAGQMVTSAGDQYAREVEGIMQAMKAKIPFYADDLPYVRNILGEKVEKVTSLGFGTVPFADAFMPIAYREVKESVVYNELRELGHGFVPPRAVRRGLDLRTFKSASGQTAYDRWLELSGQVALKGRNLSQELTRLIRSKDYQQMLADPYQNELESPRVAAIQSVLSKYQNEAYRRLLREYPELLQQEESLAQARVNAKRGVETIIPERP